jgi:hypothetical protein
MTKPVGEAFDLPDTIDLESVNAAEIAVIRLAAQGQIGSRSALRFTRMLDHRRRVIADREFEAELERLEKESKLRRSARS